MRERLTSMASERGTLSDEVLAGIYIPPQCNLTCYARREIARSK